MKKIINICLCLTVVLIVSCKKNDYINDGGISDPHVNMTTYDYLKSKPMFDSLVKVIDRAGLKETVNGNVTFFVTTNYGVADYVKAKKNEKAIELGDENIDFGIKDIPAQELSDSLKTYLYAGKINRDQMTVEGKFYSNLSAPVPNVKYLIKLRRSFEYSSYVDHVDYVNLTMVIGTRDDKEPDQSKIPKSQKDPTYDCQTSGIITTTGIVHVMDGNQRLFFNQMPLGN